VTNEPGLAQAGPECDLVIPAEAGIQPELGSDSISSELLRMEEALHGNRV
jgi:hypothetical protein